MTVRNLPDAEGQRHYMVIQNQLTCEAAQFRASVEADMLRILAGGGFNAADQVQARVNLVAALKVVLW